MSRKNVFLVISLLLIMGLIAGWSRQKLRTVAEFIQKAKSLDGKTICVQGQAFLCVDPSQAETWIFGGYAINPNGILIR